eukprot:TRINITY_DN70201_c0_g1_i1.p1 TRINITY_DN70201_c0_g1~~TRINITY_DN70201_c0_g1_i1.p1  ORF type:complete len:330 (+),score=36.51 TRINITY_DN70201_c0_g1_i1:73-1062(+)
MAAMDACDDADLETCCVCLDSLSSAPVSVLLRSTLGGSERSCPHYVHLRCADILYPRRCPLCRVPFACLSEAVDVRRLAQVGAAELVHCLRRLSGWPRANSSQTQSLVSVQGTSATAPTRAVVELLVATLPVPEVKVVEAIQLCGSEAPIGEIHEEGLTRILEFFNVRHTGSPGNIASLPPLISQYPWATWLSRRLNWAILKMTGALGSSIFFSGCGMAVGVACGGVVAVPSSRWPDMEGSNNVLLLKGIYMVMLAAYHGSKRLDLVGRGLRVGACAGLLAGCVQGLVHVNPECHGLRSVFLAGLSGSCLTAQARSRRSNPHSAIFHER